MYTTKEKGRIPTLLVEYLAGFKSISQVRQSLAMKKSREDRKKVTENSSNRLSDQYIYVLQRLNGEEAHQMDLRPRIRQPNYREDLPFEDEEYEPPNPRRVVKPYVPSILDQSWDEAYRRSQEGFTMIRFICTKGYVCRRNLCAES